MSFDLHQLVSARSKKRGLTVAAAILAATVACILFVATYPDESRLDQARAALARQQGTTRKGLLLAAEQSAARERFLADLDACWIPERDGNPETVLAAKIEKAAQQAGMKLTAVGEVRSSAVSESDGLTTLDVAVNATESMEGIARFMTELSKVRPVFYWQKCSLHPDDFRNPRNLVFSGNLRVLAVQNPAISSLAGKGK